MDVPGCVRGTHFTGPTFSPFEHMLRAGLTFKPGVAVNGRHRKVWVMLSCHLCLNVSVSQTGTPPRWHPAAEGQSKGQALHPALPGRREFPQRLAHCLQALICQGRLPFHRHLPPLVPAGLGFPLEAKAGVGIRGQSQRGRLCLHTACQHRSHGLGCLGAQVAGGLCLCPAAPPPALLPSTPFFPLPSFFLSFHVCVYTCEEGMHAPVCMHALGGWRSLGVFFSHLPPLLTPAFSLLLVCV